MKYAVDYHPKLLIIEHFDTIIFQLDIDVEKTLFKIRNPLTRSKINLKRDDFMLAINYIQKENLDYFTANADVIEKTCLEIEAKSANLQEVAFLELIKKEVIKRDCVLIKNLIKQESFSERLLIESFLCQYVETPGLALVCTPWYIDERSIEVLK